MKILHALVGYLAATTLAFYPFALASPLAATSLDYDGYVDIKLNGDSALMKRVPGDIIEARQAIVIVPTVLFIISIVADVVFAIVWIADDDPVRGQMM